jgi:hypothetical protein
MHYDVTGDGSGSITYMTDGNASTSQANGASLPWSQDLQIDSFFAPVSVIVQNQSGNGPVTCTITVDGKVVSQNHATGDYAIASCSATVK